MEQIKNVGVVEGEMEGCIEAEERLVFHVDPAMCDAEDTARVIIERGREGKPIVLVVGSASRDGTARRLIDSLKDDDRLAWKSEEIWPRKRRVGVLAGFGHLPLLVLSAAAAGPNWSNACYTQDEDYFAYRQRLRDEEVARGMRRPPKKAICSSRRRGRKFKG